MRKNQKGFSVVEALIFLVIVSVIGLAGYKVWHRSAVNNSKSQSMLADAKPQYGGAQLAAGYLTFDAARFPQVGALTKQVSMFTPVYGADKGINTVIFEGNILGFGDSGLYLYDIARNTAFRLTSGGSSAARIMSDHFVVYGYTEQQSGGTQNSIIVLNLQTGDKQTILQGDATQLTGNACCAVSPDGLRLAIPEKGKILVWSVRNGFSQTIPVQLDPFSANFPTDKSFYQKAPYFEEMNYPTLTWLNNTTLVYADHPPTAMDAGGNTTPVNNRLYLLDTANGTSVPLQDTNDGLYNVDAADNGQFIFADSASSVYRFNPQARTVVRLSMNAGAFNFYSPDGSEVFLFQGLYGPGADIGLETADSATGLTTEVALNPVPGGINADQVSQVIPEAWISDHSMLVKITATKSTQNHEWEGVYDTSANKITQYVQVD